MRLTNENETIRYSKTDSRLTSARPQERHAIDPRHAALRPRAVQDRIATGRFIANGRNTQPRGRRDLLCGQPIAATERRNSSGFQWDETGKTRTALAFCPSGFGVKALVQSVRSRPIEAEGNGEGNRLVHCLRPGDAMYLDSQRADRTSVRHQ